MVTRHVFSGETGRRARPDNYLLIFFVLTQPTAQARNDQREGNRSHGRIARSGRAKGEEVTSTPCDRSNSGFLLGAWVL